MTGTADENRVYKIQRMGGVELRAVRTAFLDRFQGFLLGSEVMVEQWDPGLQKSTLGLG